MAGKKTETTLSTINHGLHGLGHAILTTAGVFWSISAAEGLKTDKSPAAKNNLVAGVFAAVGSGTLFLRWGAKRFAAWHQERQEKAPDLEPCTSEAAPADAARHSIEERHGEKPSQPRPGFEELKEMGRISPSKDLSSGNQR